uniref:NADH dehydrogenase subunit 6 n=1 Tax=Chuniphyes multidentata TaxID=316200 RepID=UPI0026E482F6|nr:NADH dehydrogenase subunit 6 [Chuniphyes multidentata]WJJ69916.1 NADH dehydrogenase subunit 6 [Chuniphyes multidentata]
MELLYYLFSCLALVASLFVLLSSSPVYGVCWLVLVFLCSSCCLFCLGVEFIPLILIIVYVGAITILFLFVIMMINNNIQLQVLSIFHIWLILLYIILNIILSLHFLNPTKIISQTSWIYSHWGEVSNMGLLLYSELLLPLLILTFILLVGLIGAILLAIQQISINNL